MCCKLIQEHNMPKQQFYGTLQLKSREMLNDILYNSFSLKDVQNSKCTQILIERMHNTQTFFLSQGMPDMSNSDDKGL